MKIRKKKEKKALMHTMFQQDPQVITSYWNNQHDACCVLPVLKPGGSVK